MKKVNLNEFKTDSCEVLEEAQALRDKVAKLEKENEALWNRLRALSYL